MLSRIVELRMSANRKTMFDYLENGESLEDFLEGFPTVNRELAVQILEESRELRLARV